MRKFCAEHLFSVHIFYWVESGYVTLYLSPCRQDCLQMAAVVEWMSDHFLISDIRI